MRNFRVRSSPPEEYEPRLEAMLLDELPRLRGSEHKARKAEVQIFGSRHVDDRLEAVAVVGRATRLPAIFDLVDGVWKDAGYGSELYLLVVRPDRRGEGVARAGLLKIVTELLSQIPTDAPLTLQGQVHEANAPCQGLLRAFGFTPVERGDGDRYVRWERTWLPANRP